MKTQGIFPDLNTFPASRKRAPINTLALCTLLLAAPVFAQQTTEAGANVRQQDAIADTVAQNMEDGATESSSQPQASLPDSPSASQHAYPNTSSLTLGERFTIYSHSIISPYTVVGPALGAGIGQWENEPPGWGQGGDGYARRLASGMGRQLISETIRFGFAAADGEDPRFQRSAEEGVWSRVRHAISETFTSRTESGGRIPAFSRFAGAYGAAFISNTWYPESRATTGYALRRGSTALGRAWDSISSRNLSRASISITTLPLLRKGNECGIRHLDSRWTEITGFEWFGELGMLVYRAGL